MAALQQPGLASATQQADFSVQQAGFLAQQLAFAASGFVAQQAVAVAATGFVVPQHALASLQQAEPSVQHFGEAEQQACFSSQHFRPFSQQPNLASAAQQALLGVQQASLAEQQSLACSAPEAPPASSAPRTRNEPANSFVNTSIFSSKKSSGKCRTRNERSTKVKRPMTDGKRTRALRFSSAKRTGECVEEDRREDQHGPNSPRRSGDMK